MMIKLNMIEYVSGYYPGYKPSKPVWINPRYVHMVKETSVKVENTLNDVPCTEICLERHIIVVKETINEVIEKLSGR